ncbi:Sodium/bile acid cotransporter [Hondaea fermentalgiana]|uniref:Sodium/bile acid cotransporter n=1 Tax=Hondaea fermentalgiana TaxID=2315210 RepID=A0A2R5GPA1_9STRA|nr:Sodium/bile acid cotransporter [Hondaea fermentalgiana]|eukprot:GBG32702.1 Sodium/bile acid cotransporter [Hondaea fermentalgiana]
MPGPASRTAWHPGPLNFDAEAAALSPDEPTVELSCAAVHSNIVSVATSSGLNTTCYDASDAEGTYGAFEGNVEACASARAAVSKACKGEKSCSVDLSDALAACGGEAVHVTVRCDEVLDVFAIMGWLLVISVAVAMGAMVRVEDIRKVFDENKRGVLVGLASQYVFMPLLAFVYTKIFGFSDLVAIGAVVVGSSPGGTSSNLFAYLSRGNVPLSIVMSALSTAVAFVMMPFNIYLYGNLGLGLNEGVRGIPFARILFTMVVVIASTVLGMVILHFSARAAKWATRIGALLGVAFVAGAFAIAVRENGELLDPSRFPKLWIAAALFQPLGTLFGGLFAGYAGLRHKDQRTVGIETGVQNFSIAYALLSNVLQGCDRSEALSFPLLAGAWFFIDCIIITIVLRCCHAPCDGREHLETETDSQVEIRDLSKANKSGKVQHGSLSDDEDESLSLSSSDASAGGAASEEETPRLRVSSPSDIMTAV